MPGTSKGQASDLSGAVIRGTFISNSTTYVDLLGVLAGFERMPGETASEFADRIARSSVLPRGADYIGLMNEVVLQLGFEMHRAISLEAEGGVSVVVSLSGVHAVWGQGSISVPILRIGPDDFWEWRSLAEVAADLKLGSGLNVALLIDDGPAFQLVRQTNLMTVVGEVAQGQLIKLEHPGLVIGSELFNQTVPTYTIQEDSSIFFTAPVPPGTRITYKYQVYPYALLASPVFLLGLLDSELASLAVTPRGKLVHQVQEFVQELAAADLSYWAV